jgi:hypothetical protein
VAQDAVGHLDVGGVNCDKCQSSGPPHQRSTIQDQRALYRMCGTVFAPLHRVGFASHRRHGNIGEQVCRHLRQVAVSIGLYVLFTPDSAYNPAHVPSRSREKLAVERRGSGEECCRTRHCRGLRSPSHPCGAQTSHDQELPPVELLGEDACTTGGTEAPAIAHKSDGLREPRSAGQWATAPQVRPRSLPTLVAPAAAGFVGLKASTGTHHRTDPPVALVEAKGRSDPVGNHDRRKRRH